MGRWLLGRLLHRFAFVLIAAIFCCAVGSGQSDEASGLRPDGQPRAAVTTFSCSSLSSPSTLSSSSSTSSGVRLKAVDSVIQAAIQDGTIPGAVLVVGHDGRGIYPKAYGARALEPRREVMTIDTVFDMASLTKAIVTTTAVMQLMEQGKVRLNDPVVKYLPEFAQSGKEDITRRQLRHHSSGLAPHFALQMPWG